MKKNLVDNIGVHKLWTVGTALSVTLNPSDYYQSFRGKNDGTSPPRGQGRFEEVFKFFDKIIHKWLAKFNAIKEYRFYPEISKTGRIHLHGYMIVNDPIQLAVNIGFIKNRSYINLDLDTVDAVDDWHKYITKDQHLFNNIEWSENKKDQHNKIILKELV